MRPSRVQFERAIAAGLAAFALLVAGSSVPFAARGQSAAPGKELFEKRCGGCHGLERDREGPRLRGVLGRAAGSVPSFQYSDGLRTSGITWTAQMLDRWLTDPEKLVKDTDMAFRVDSPEERRAIIDYLQRASSR
ncbi:MAG TPA: c-type cytochrome [Bryobacteraceae bacterium]|jgi:cytochrome c